MSGNEIIGKEELNSIKDIFKRSNGVLFSHGFDLRRNKIYRVEILKKIFAKINGSKYAIACSSGTASRSNLFASSWSKTWRRSDNTNTFAWPL